MAFVSSNRASVGFGDRIVAIFTVAGQAMQRRRTYLRTLRELNALDDRELTDLGLTRSDISNVAHQAAYGV